MNANEYYDEDPNIDQERKERKKKRHRRPKEEKENEEEMYNGGGRVDLSVAVRVGGRGSIRSEEDGQEVGGDGKRRQKHRRSRVEADENEDTYRGREIEEVEVPMSMEDEEEARRLRKEKRRRAREKKKALEDPYLNLQSPTSDVNDYPFESAGNEYDYQDEDPQYDDQLRDSLQEEEDIHTSPPPEEPKPKKKGSAFGKIFASFKKRGKNNKKEAPITDQWQSNPEIFNPGLDSQPGTLEKSKKKVPGKAARNIPVRKAHVILLDGEEVEVDVDVKATGSVLFDHICSNIDLIEKDFFGMTYVNPKLQTWFWLEMDKKISKQIGKDDDWTFNFQVKFYPPEPVLLQEDLTRYLLSLQVRQDVYTCKLPCSWITQALLGSFMVQSELGDYDELEHGDNIDYLREFEFVLNQSDQLLDKICELHKKHFGMTPDRADIKYMETAKRLEQYGVDLHPARDNDDVEIFIGVSYQGILIYRDRLRIGRFAWPKVLRISYKKNYFYLKIRSDRYDDSVAIVGFKLFNHFLAKRLWKNAAEQHTFFRMKEPQMHKLNNKLMPTTSSNFTYGGKTLHQYRTMNINRTEPVHFDRTIAKRRTIGSMPAGLNRAGMQYSSMHSLNRAHPRDMTLGKTKSIEHLSSKRTGSMGALTHNREGSLNSYNNSRQNAQPSNPGYGSMLSSKGEEPLQSFHSGESLNGGESYTVNRDELLSLPPMSPSNPPGYHKPTKKPRSKTPSNDAFSDDGILTPPPKDRGRANVNVPRMVPLPQLPIPHSSDSDHNEVIIQKPKFKKSHSRQSEFAPAVSSPTNNRPTPQFKPPPPPPESIPEPPSVSSSIRSFQIDHRMPPPPPLMLDLNSYTDTDRVVSTKTSATERSKPPPVKPKPKMTTREQVTVIKTTVSRHDDDML